MMERLIAYACLAISGAFAARYGYTTGDGELGSVLRAGGWAMAAIVGGCTPAWALHHWDCRKFGRFGLTIILGVLCWAMTIYGSVGGFAGSADRKIAERTRAIDSSAADKAELARLITQQKQVRAIGAIEADIARTKEETGRWWQLKGELASAKQAQELDGKITALKANLYSGEPAVAADPGAAALAIISGKPAQEIAAWSMLLGAIALEMAGMIAMMRAEALPQSPLSAPDERLDRTEAAPALQPEDRKPRLEERRAVVPAVRKEVLRMERRASPSKDPTAGTPPLPLPKHGVGHVYGSVRKYAEQNIVEEAGSRLALKAIVEHYKAWCERGSLPPASFERFCDDIDSVLDIAVDGSTVYGMNVRFA